MSSAVTVHDVMTRAFLGVSEGDGVLETVGLLLDDGAERAVVLRGRDPVGTMSERDALALLARGADPEAATVSDVMSREVVRVSSGVPLAAAAEEMSRTGVAWLLAVEEDDPVGVVTAHDVVAASTMVPDDTPSMAVPAGTNDPEEEYDTQGICESCGSLARDLVDANGRLVCSNCREA